MSKNMARHLRLKHSEIFEQTQDLRRYRPRKGVSSQPISWVKKYCYMVDENKYKCDICGTVLSMPKGIYNNMKRHIKTRHPFVYNKEVKQVDTGRKENSKCEDKSDEDSEDYLDKYIADAKESLKARRSTLEKQSEIEGEGIEVSHEEVIESEFEVQNTIVKKYTNKIGLLSESDPEYEEKIKYLCLDIVMGKRRPKNCIYNFFDVIEENHIYACLACNNQVAIFPQSISNLKRHIRLKHKRQYQIMLKYMETEKKIPTSFEKFYFDTNTKGQYKCKGCGDILTCLGDDQQVLFDHFKENHLRFGVSRDDKQSDDDDEYSLVLVKKKDIQLDLEAC